MRHTALITGILAVISAVMVVQAAPGQTSAFKLASPDIVQGHKIGAAQVYNSFGCSGQNISPTMGWSNPPAGTQSFALMVYDPDAPTGSGWWHWVVYNIPANIDILPAGAGNPDQHRLPAGALQGRTDFGSHEYGGPCPPPGKPHHYHFRLYALKVAKLDVPADASAAFISFNIHANEIAESVIVALYSR
jgi:Raf kinase inhibitor-like YbhB/YbcL family protein